MLKLIFAAIVYIIVTHVISCEMSFLSFLLAAYIPLVIPDKQYKQTAPESMLITGALVTRCHTKSSLMKLGPIREDNNPPRHSLLKPNIAGFNSISLFVIVASALMQYLAVGYPTLSSYRVQQLLESSLPGKCISG